MALPPPDATDQVAHADASFVSVSLSPRHPAASASTGAPVHQPPQQQLRVFFDRKASSRETVEQQMCVPSIMPIQPLDEKEVKAAHSHLRRKVRNHVVPWLFVLVLLIAMCGRNQGVAALSMQPRLGLTDAQYGLGSSVFYAGVIVTQLPSVMLGRCVGVPMLLAATLTLWSVTTALFALLPYASDVISPFYGFCALRLVLGAAEGALVPMMYLYLSTWYGALPDNLASRHGQVTIAAQVASVLGGVVAAKILLLDGVGGLDGWQWIFLLQAAPVLLAAWVTPAVLARDPEHARWLDLDEKKMLAEQRITTGPDGFRRTTIRANDSSSAAFADDRVVSSRSRTQGPEPDVEGGTESATAGEMLSLVLTNCSVAYLAVCVLLLQLTLWSLVYWQPTLIKLRMPASSSDYEVALISALPHLCGLIGTLLLGWLASHACCDRQKRMAANAVSRTERRWHSATAMIIGGAALTLATNTLGTDSLVTPLVLLCTANGFLWAVGGLLFTWPNVWLNKQAAVVALAVLNMASAVGGLIGPLVVGILTQAMDAAGQQTGPSLDAAPTAAATGAPEWASGLGSDETGSVEPLESVGAPSSTSMFAMHAAVGLLGGCAIVAGLMAACFRPKAQAPPPPASASEGTGKSAVEVIVE